MVQACRGGGFTVTVAATWRTPTAYGDFATEAEKFAEDIRSLKRPKTEPGDDGLVQADQEWLARTEASSLIAAAVRTRELLNTTYGKGEVDASAAKASWDVNEEVEQVAAELNVPEETPPGSPTEASDAPPGAPWDDMSDAEPPTPTGGATLVCDDDEDS